MGAPVTAVTACNNYLEKHCYASSPCATRVSAVCNIVTVILAILGGLYSPLFLYFYIFIFQK